MSVPSASAREDPFGDADLVRTDPVGDLLERPEEGGPEDPFEDNPAVPEPLVPDEPTTIGEDPTRPADRIDEQPAPAEPTRPAEEGGFRSLREEAEEPAVEDGVGDLGVETDPVLDPAVGETPGVGPDIPPVAGVDDGLEDAGTPGTDPFDALDEIVDPALDQPATAGRDLEAIADLLADATDATADPLAEEVLQAQPTAAPVAAPTVPTRNLRRPRIPQPDLGLDGDLPGTADAVFDEERFVADVPDPLGLDDGAATNGDELLEDVADGDPFAALDENSRGRGFDDGLDDLFGTALGGGIDYDLGLSGGLSAPMAVDGLDNNRHGHKDCENGGCR